MVKSEHEFRDPIHVFIRLSNRERKIVDSEAYQRLRNIHQLALTYLVYPGATHKRFEHCLGVLHLADSAFGVLVRNLDKAVAGDLMSDLTGRDLENARAHLRMAALLHDVGHYPFSHVGEEGGLLPPGWDHEAMSIKLICSDPLSDLLRREAEVDPFRVARIAVGAEAEKYADLLEIERRELKLTPLDALLSEIITGDFGVDRMDYLLRDSHHTGVPYGKFDHHRLIDSFRLAADPRPENSGRPRIAIQKGGVLCAHHLLLARYYMFSQVYYHPVRQAYDFHLRDFFKKVYPGEQLPTEPSKHLLLTDVEIEYAIRTRDEPEAKTLARRQHVKLFYETNSLEAGVAREVFSGLKLALPSDALVHLAENKAKKVKDFLVLDSNNELVSSMDMRTDWKTIPGAAPHYVFVEQKYLDLSAEWKKQKLPKILKEVEAKRKKREQAEKKAKGVVKS